jgi:hypothetical protein
MKILKYTMMVALVLCGHSIIAMDEPEDTVEEIKVMDQSDMSDYYKRVNRYLATLTDQGEKNDYIKAVNKLLAQAGKLGKITATTPTTVAAQKTWKDLAPSTLDLQAAIKSIEVAAGSPNQPLTQDKQKKQLDIMQQVVAATNFDENNIQNSSIAAAHLKQALDQAMSASAQDKPARIDDALMTGFCLKANQEGGAQGSSLNPAEAINAALGTAIPANANADALLELAVRAPLP